MRKFRIIFYAWNKKQGNGQLREKAIPLLTRGYFKKENNVTFFLLYREENFIGINVLEKILINDELQAKYY